MTNQAHTSLLTLCAALLVTLPVAALSEPIPVTDTITITGELTEDDFLATDASLLSFYYDIIDFEATSTTAITITFESDDFAAFIGWGFDLGLPPWPFESNEPYLDDRFNYNICLSAPGTHSMLPVKSPTIGQTFQVFIATCAYNPTTLGAYSLTLDDGVVPMPEPGSLALLGIGLIGLAASRRRRQRNLRSNLNFLSV